MAKFDLERARKLLQQFDFTASCRGAGWEQPGQARPKLSGRGDKLHRRQIARLSGVVVFELTATDGNIRSQARAAVQQQITGQFYENLVIL